MMIELDDNEARLRHAVVLEKAQEHFSYANTSEVADRLCKLAARFTHPSRDSEAVNDSYAEAGAPDRTRTPSGRSSLTV